MKAASEEVNKTLEKAGQKISLEDKPIYLNQIELDSMPVLGGFGVLALICDFMYNHVIALKA